MRLRPHNGILRRVVFHTPDIRNRLNNNVAYGFWHTMEVRNRDSLEVLVDVRANGADVHKVRVVSDYNHNGVCAVDDMALA